MENSNKTHKNPVSILLRLDTHYRLSQLMKRPEYEGYTFSRLLGEMLDAKLDEMEVAAPEEAVSPLPNRRGRTPTGKAGEAFSQLVTREVPQRFASLFY